MSMYGSPQLCMPYRVPFMGSRKSLKQHPQGDHFLPWLKRFPFTVICACWACSCPYLVSSGICSHTVQKHKACCTWLVTLWRGQHQHLISLSSVTFTQHLALVSLQVDKLCFQSPGKGLSSTWIWPQQGSLRFAEAWQAQGQDDQRAGISLYNSRSEGRGQKRKNAPNVMYKYKYASWFTDRREFCRNPCFPFPVSPFIGLPLLQKFQHVFYLSSEWSQNFIWPNHAY